MPFAIFASTGTGTNLQQFNLTEFVYSTDGSYIRVLYVDDLTGEVLKDELHSGLVSEVLDLKDELTLPNYMMKRSNITTSLGYQSDQKIAYKLGIQTITYTYKKVDKENYKPL